MDLLYRNMVEVSRVVEEVDVTEEGTFKKDRTPETYGGSILKMKIVHRVTMADKSGRLLTLKFQNPEPLNQDKSGVAGEIILDGESIEAGIGDPREWTTIRNGVLDERLASLVAQVQAIEASGGAEGSIV